MPELVGELAGDLSGARLFYIGAFPDRRIAGQPVAWMVSPAAGRFTLPVPAGRWYIHAVGVPAADMGFPDGITWGSHGGIYGFGRPVSTDTVELLHIALSPLWRDVTHLPLHQQPALTDEQWQAVTRGMETLTHDLSSSVEGDAALAAGLVRTRFSALFKRGMGLSPEEYRMRVRLEAAKALLVETDRDVLEAALEVGYSTPAQLGRLFQRYLGVAPGEFRRLARLVGWGTGAGAAAGAGAGAPSSSPSARWAGAASWSVAHRILSAMGRSGATVRGEVLYPGAGQGGTVYVGLFPGAIPDAYPAAWVSLPAPGPFTLRRVAPGRYHLLACYCRRRMRYPGDLRTAFAYGGYGDVDMSGRLERWHPLPLDLAGDDTIGGLTVEMVDGDAINRFGGSWLQRFLPDGR